MEFTAGTSILGALLRASLQGGLVIAAVWLVCRLLPRLPASVRCGLWWLACAKLAVSLVWAEPVRLALLPAPAPPAEVVLAVPATSSTLSDTSFVAPAAPAAPFPWERAVLGAWGAGVLLLLAATTRQHRRARRVVHRSAPVAEPWLAGLFAELRARLGVPGRTAVRLSSDVETPQVMGLVHPVVLLPASAAERLSPLELALTLCHELVHVRRGDLWLGWVPALAQRLFFFHPLAHLAAREYALAREAACDAEVLRVLDPAPETYGRLLLRLGVTSKVPRLAAASAAPSFQILKRRLQMLQNATDKKRLHPAWWALVALVALVGLVPFTITAQEAPETPEAPEALPTPHPVAAPLPVAQVAQHDHAYRATPPTPPIPPVPPVPPVPPRGMHLSDGEPYVLLLPGKSVVMNGSTWDVRRARKLRANDDEELFWFEREGESYVIRDAATLRRIRDLFEPQQKLGERQAALGGQQAELGGKQAGLGGKQAELGAKQAEVGARMGKLGAEQARLDREGDTEALEAQLKQLETKMHDLEREMDKYGTPQEELSRQQEELSRQQEALGRQQEELGRQQEELARKAEKQLAELVDQAVANGTAKKLK
jgi:beta-lactamase regulating signal transducer with metallopeptidase domain